MPGKAVIYGIQTYFGFALCESFLNEGLEVVAIKITPNDRLSKHILEERLMMIGRNALLTVVSGSEKHVTKVNKVIYCSDDSNDTSMAREDSQNFRTSVELAKELQVPYYYISMNYSGDVKKGHTSSCEEYLRDHLENTVHIKFPVLYGPYQPPTNQIHQYLLKYLKGEKDTLRISEPVLYIEDAIKAFWNILDQAEQGKTYSVQGDVKLEKCCTFPIKLSFKDINDGVSGEKYHIKATTSLENGLKQQLNCMKECQDLA